MASAKSKSNLAGGFKLPKKPASAPATKDADAFVKAGDQKPALTASARRRIGRGERLAVYIPPELAEQVRIRCVRERCSVSHAATEAFALWVKA